jgi:hypothetical protein
MSNTYASKVKPYYGVFVAVIIYVMVSFILGIFFGEAGDLVVQYFQDAFFWVLGLLFLGSFIRTKNLLVLASFILLLIPSWGVPIFRYFLHLKSYVVDIIQIFGLFLCFLPFFLLASKYPGGGGLFFRYFRNLLEMAAMPVKDTTNGYTNRPYPAGKFSASKDEIAGFAKYLNKNLIATSFIEEDKVMLVFSNGFFQYIPFIKVNTQKETYISLYYSGDIDVHIAKKDYRKYRDELTFNQLCTSFGNVILILLSYYKKRECEKIINILEDKKLIPSDDS